jgi:protein-tyrosine phosphatase
MIDFHTHILPALDDGAQNVETARKIVELEQEQGVKTLVFTPHYYGMRRSPEQFKQERDTAFEKIKPYLGDIKTVLGAEVHFTAHSAATPEGIASLAIGNGKYVLLELPFDQRWSRQLFDKIGEFIRLTSCTPIISHVERYGQVLRHPKYLSELLNMGCLLQINAASLQNPRTRALTKAILKHGMAHCIGSDTHNLSDRAPNLKDAKAHFEKDGFAAEFDKAQALMKRILNGETVTVDSTQKIKKCLWKFY